MKIAVAGGTGVVGSHVVAAAQAAGHQAVILARSTGVDIFSGSGLGEALTGVDAVIDVANKVTLSAKPAVTFFETSTRNLIEAGQRAGVQHHVVMSIVGIDDVDYGYYLGKRAQEQTALSSGAPVSILRATQFHEFPGQLMDRTKGPFAVIPRMKVQTVAAAEVAQALLALATGPVAGRSPDIAGPEVHELPELARLLRAARSSKRPLLTVSLPGKVGKAMRTGALLPTGDGLRGTLTFENWLKQPR
jgi:uncharacterized protein YbjT (DUF2867 family)